MKQLVSLTLVLATTLMPMSALAMTQANPTTQTSTTNTAAISRIKTMADSEIGRRITTLNNLMTVTTAATHLSSSDRATLVGQINPELLALPSLKTKIDNDTDLPTLKTDVQSIYTEFRVYALLIPKVHLAQVADRLSDASAKLTDYADKLQPHIDRAKAAGKDVTSETTTMADMRAQITIANTDFTAAVHDLINITPAQYNTNKAVVTTDRDTLNGGRQAAAKALADGNKIRDGLKSLGQI